MAVGRISGPLLKANLERFGVDLAFETDLLYLDVNNQRIGVKNTTPQYELDITGDVRSTNIRVESAAQFGDVTISGDTISSDNLNIRTVDGIVYQSGIIVDDLLIKDNYITTTASNANLELRANGTGEILVADSDVRFLQGLNIQGGLNVENSLVTGTLTATRFTNESIRIDGNVLETIESNSDLEIRTSGTGEIWLDNPTNINQNLNVTGSITANAGTINQVVATTLNSQQITNTGSITVGDFLTVTGDAQFENIRIRNNTIETTDSNSNLELDAAGVGTIELLADTNVTGNLHATGNISADGNITLGDQNTDSVTLNANVASDIIPDVDDTYVLGSETQRWANVWVNRFIAENIDATDVQIDGINLALRPGNTIYVSENGDDLKTGTHPFDPKQTLSEALSIASAGDTVHIYPGVYTEVFPLVVPAGVTVQGSGIRAVTIQPTIATNTNDAFLLNGECTVEDLTVANFFAPGYAFKFDTNASVTTKSPYIRNISVITKGSNTTSEDPLGYNSADAGRGVLVDGSAVAVGSKEASMLFHSVTFIVPNADGLVATNGARVEWLNSFSYFSDRSVYAFDGTAGKYNNGKTKIRLGGITGTFASGDTVTFTSTDGSTVVNALVDSVDGDVISVDGKFNDLDGFDTTPQSITAAPSGASATSIENYDRKDFGAEIRMIGSASVYGNRGLVGDGEGVIVYAIGHNLAYIGNGKEVTNDPTTVIQANEVVETNNAKIVYNSVDHEGDFRVGDQFFVDQQTGNVTFNTANFTINTSGGLTITDGVDTTFIDATKIDTGNLRISGNTISSLSGAINLDAFSNQINLNSNVNVSGNLDVSGNVSIGGNITIGDEATDTVQFVAGIDSNIIPAVDSTYSLGELTKRWLNIYVNEINTDDVQIRDNYITTTVSSSDLELRANGTGEVLVPSNDVSITNDLTVLGTTNLSTTQVTGNITQTGNFVQTGETTITGRAVIDNVQVDGNTVSATGGSTLILDGVTVEVANNLEVDADLSVTGTTNLVDTSITGTFTVTGNSNYTGSVDIVGNTSVTGTLDITGQARFEEILINDNFITTTTSDTDLELRASGTGKIYVPSNDVRIENTLTVTGTSTVVDVNASGTITANQFNNGVITIAGDTITSSANGITLNANGTGDISIPSNDVDILQNLTVQGTTTLAQTNVTGDLTVTGSIVQTGNLDVTGTISNGDIEIAGNVIQTTQVDSNLVLQASGTGNVTVPSNNVTISGTTTVSGTTNLQNTVVTGDITHTGNVVQTGDYDVTGNFSVSGNATIAGTASFENIEVAGNTVQTTESNSDLELRAAGTGRVVVPSNDVQVNGNLNVDGISTVSFSGNSVSVNTFTTGDILIDDNYITTTNSNSDLELRAAGTGSVIVDEFDFNENTISRQGDIVLNPNNNNIVINSTDSLVIPKGTTAERPSTPESGMIRYNTDDNTFEGYFASSWGSIAKGVVDSDGDTKITAELTPGANDNTIRFYAANNLTATLDINGFEAPKIQAGDIVIDGNTITTDATDTDINLSPTGTGSVVIDDLSISNNTISNTVADSVTTFSAPNGGYFKIDTNRGFVIPTGGNLTRPPANEAEIGMTRYNTDDARMEVFDGTSWVSVAGSSGGLDQRDAEDLAIGIVLALG